MNLITIFTPTYNRAHLLPRLYESLKRQTCKDFDWLVVDDGSSDGTNMLLEAWQRETDFAIRYIYKENGGKMKAHNLGVMECKTELFMCLDSDDYLTDDCVERIYVNWDKHKSCKDVAGMVAYREMSGQKAFFFPEVVYSTLQNINRTYVGETALAFKNDILKAYLFPELEGENFIAEGYVYDQLDAKYQLAVIPEYWIKCEYQKGGLTDTALSLLVKNPKGWALNAKIKYSFRASSFKDRIRWTSTYICASLFAGCGIGDIIMNAPNALMCILCFPLGVAQKLNNSRKLKK